MKDESIEKLYEMTYLFWYARQFNRSLSVLYVLE